MGYHARIQFWKDIKVIIGQIKVTKLQNGQESHLEKALTTSKYRQSFEILKRNYNEILGNILPKYIVNMRNEYSFDGSRTFH